MERKIGEIFEHQGEWYQCVQNDKVSCDDCDFTEYCESYSGSCDSTSRTDGKGICFKKLEKVGEPYSCNYYGDNRMVMMQEYKVNDIYTTILPEGVASYIVSNKHKRIAITVESNQKDMKENKLKLKPFDLEAARSGKPVCTRDGRKARIICFDRQGSNQRIVALILYADNIERIESFHSNGKFSDTGEHSELDLMMLPEKHEGWINICNKLETYAGAKIYRTKEDAVNSAKGAIVDVIDTVKICWEE